MQQRAPVEAVYALKGWTIRNVGDKFFIAPTAHFGDRPQWSKPYRSLQNATAAIARKLAEEFTMRQNRIAAFRSKKRK
jgi:hypothetical protein